MNGKDTEAACRTAGYDLRRRKEVRQNIATAAAAFTLALLINTFIAQIYYIDSGSMLPTLHVNDRVLVEQATHRAREPRVGELLVFKDAEPGANGNTPVIKRVAGIQGDIIEIRDGVLYRNGTIDPHLAGEAGENFGPYTVPESSAFMLGDNRYNSLDSRQQLGSVPYSQITGRAVAVIWPMEHARMLHAAGRS